MTARRFDPEPALLGAVRIGLALVLLTPLVTAPWTLYPFSVGKALWARVLIAAVFALWAVLALAAPALAPAAERAARRARRRPRRGGALGPVRGRPRAELVVELRAHAGDRERRALGPPSPSSPPRWRAPGRTGRGCSTSISRSGSASRRSPSCASPRRRRRCHFPSARVTGRGSGRARATRSCSAPTLQAIALLAVGFLVRSCCAAAPSAPVAPGRRGRREPGSPAPRRAPVREGARAPGPRRRMGRAAVLGGDGVRGACRGVAHRLARGARRARGGARHGLRALCPVRPRAAGAAPRAGRGRRARGRARSFSRRSSRSAAPGRLPRRRMRAGRSRSRAAARCSAAAT